MKYKEYKKQIEEGCGEHIEGTREYNCGVDYGSGVIFCEECEAELKTMDACEQMLIEELKEEIKLETIKKNEGRTMYFIDLNSNDVNMIIDKVLGEEPSHKTNEEFTHKDWDRDCKGGLLPASNIYDCCVCITCGYDSRGRKYCKKPTPLTDSQKETENE